MGLSPLVRGKHCSQWFPSLLVGSIPACAGETQAGRSVDQQSKVYPRLCGGNGIALFLLGLLLGLSPLVRGKLGFSFSQLLLLGSIPACAGETLVFNIMIC